MLARLEGVPSALAAARDAVDVVLRDRGLRRPQPDEVRAALVAGARANARLSDEPQRWLPGALRLAAELQSLSELITVAPGQALARAHALLVVGQTPEPSVGRLREDPAAAARMAELASLLAGPAAAPALVLAAVAHAEIAVVEPFGVADEMVARAVEHMVLITTGVDPAALVVVEGGHAADPSAYRRSLLAYRSGTVNGVRAWLLHCAQALTIGAQESALALAGPTLKGAEGAEASIGPHTARRPRMAGAEPTRQSE